MVQGATMVQWTAIACRNHSVSCITSAAACFIYGACKKQLAQTAIGLAQLTTSFVIRSFWAASSAAILRWYAARRIVRLRLLADIPFPCVYALSTMIGFSEALRSHSLLLRSHSQRIGLVLINLPDLRQGLGTAPATSDSR